MKTISALFLILTLVTGVYSQDKINNDKIYILQPYEHFTPVMKGYFIEYNLFEHDFWFASERLPFVQEQLGLLKNEIAETQLMTNIFMWSLIVVSVIAVSLITYITLDKALTPKSAFTF